MRFWLSDLSEGLIEIGDDVLGVFKAYGKADESGGNAGGLKILGAVGGMGHGGGVLDKRLGIAEGYGDSAKLEGVAQLHAGFLAALYLEGYHTAEVLHLLLCDLVSGVSGETGIIDLLDLVVVVEVFSYLLCAFCVARNAYLKGLEAAEDEP